MINAFNMLVGLAFNTSEAYLVLFAGNKCIATDRSHYILCTM